MYSAQAQDSYNLFLTSAITDGIKLWDLRTSRLVPIIYLSLYWLQWLPHIKVMLQQKYENMKICHIEIRSVIKKDWSCLINVWCQDF